MTHHIFCQFCGVCPYIPNFRGAFQHCRVHAGGRATLVVVQRSVSLEDEDLKPNKCTHAALVQQHQQQLALVRASPSHSNQIPIPVRLSPTSLSAFLCLAA